MIKADKYFKQNIKRILEEGSWDENPRPKWKDGTPARSKFITGIFEEYNISKGEFPITTLRKTAVQLGIREMHWIYFCESNCLSLAHVLGIKWWNEFGIGDGTIGQRYGATVKKYNLFNKLIEGLKNDPFSRRHIIDLYQYSDFEETEGLLPCAFQTMWSVRKNGGKLFLDMTLTQRSNDYIMAGYINKVQYVALMMHVANEVGLECGMFRHLTQNLHIYDRHMDAARELLEKQPLATQPLLKQEKDRIFSFKLLNAENITNIESKLELAV